MATFIVTIEILSFCFSTEETDIEIDSIEIEAADESILVDSLHERFDQRTDYISTALGHYDIQACID